MTASLAAPDAAFDNDEALLARVLRIYKPHCRYLKSMTMTVTGVIGGRGVLEIGESCYTDETGHLNAVEANIGYNQMLYYVIAKSVQERLGPTFSSWTMDDFWRRQLPDILITKLTSTFRRPINPRRFYGEFELTHATQRRLTSAKPPLMSLDTTFRYWDDHKGQSSGAVTVAIIGS